MLEAQIQLKVLILNPVKGQQERHSLAAQQQNPQINWLLKGSGCHFYDSPFVDQWVSQLLVLVAQQACR